MSEMSIEDYRRLQPRSKYRNAPTFVNGIRFDSRAEAMRYRELKLLAAQGHISDLRLQPRYVVHDAFVCAGQRERAIHYVADFAYNDERGDVVEDVKGKRTPVYNIKRKLFLARYGDAVTFVEIEV